MSNSLAKAVRSGGITQQEARFTWLLLGFTWYETRGRAQRLAVDLHEGSRLFIAALITGLDLSSKR